MKRSKGYELKEIAGVPYLLPIGQMVADHRRGIQINHTGAYLWQLLEKEHTAEELLRLCAAHYHAAPEELPHLERELSHFLRELVTYGILEDSHSIQTPSASSCKYVEIGGLTLKIEGPPEAVSEHFDAFTIPARSQVHQTITLHRGAPLWHTNGDLLLRSKDFVVLERNTHYILIFPSMGQLPEVHLTKDASHAVFYCIPPYTDTFRENLFHAIRSVYLYLAQKHHMTVLHSASLLYRGRAWLFSGCSGTGKSTHTRLWNELLHTPLINGDLNLLALENGQALIHGLPWCGTSGIWDTKTYPLGGIILLKQAKEDRTEELSPDKKQLLVMQRFISPTWTGEQLSQNLSFVKELADRILICRLHCTKEPSAASVMKSAIDKYLEETQGLH